MSTPEIYRWAVVALLAAAMLISAAVNVAVILS